jgi:hypothetical protein
VHTVLLLPAVLLAVFCPAAAVEIVALPFVDHWTRVEMAPRKEEKP